MTGLHDPGLPIYLTRGMVALVSECDYPLVSKHKWAFQAKNAQIEDTGYASRFVPLGNGKRLKVYLHREIVQPPPGKIAEHKNGDGLDCRRSNLRLANHIQNRANRAYEPGLSGFIGVSRSGMSRWRAKMEVDQKTVHLGTYATKEEAAQAYDRAVIERHGVFAVLNFPVETYGLSIFPGHEKPRSIHEDIPFFA